MKTFILLTIFILSALNGTGQTMELRGVIVEVSEGQPKGIPGVTISVFGQDYDITDERGNFVLNIKPKEDFVILTLENCPYPLIDPYAGQVNLPPSGALMVRVCARENQKLQSKIQNLNSRIGKLEREGKLSRRQLESMQRTLLDTVLFYENQLNSLTENLREKDTQITESQDKIAHLEQKTALLEQQLFAALEEKYLRQHQTLDNITADLNAYRSRLKDVYRELGGIADCFLHPQGCDNFYSAVRKYSEARNRIDETHQGNITSVAHYWADPKLPVQMEETYNYILQTIHEPVMFGMVNERVLDPLKVYAAKKKGRLASQKEVTNGAEAARVKLESMIAGLDVKIELILGMLTRTI